MKLPIQPVDLPMEAIQASEIPLGPQWQYEPKWDGFRCLVFRDNDSVELQSKSGQPESFIEPPGFTGRSPGGPSRWSTERSAEWVPLAPQLVVEVSCDHVTNGRFRHGTRLLRWRPDKNPRQCTMEQIRRGKSRSLMLLDKAS